jgi:hypothetical protein
VYEWHYAAIVREFKHSGYHTRRLPLARATCRIHLANVSLSLSLLQDAESVGMIHEPSNNQLGLFQYADEWSVLQFEDIADDEIDLSSMANTSRLLERFRELDLGACNFTCSVQNGKSFKLICRLSNVHLQCIVGSRNQWGSATRCLFTQQ